MLENMEITFVVAEKQICAILLTEPAKNRKHPCFVIRQ